MSNRAWFQFDASDVWTLFHSFAFDFSVWEVWGALSSGGRLVVVPYWVSRSPESFYDLLRAHRRELDKLVDALLEKEELDRSEIEELLSPEIRRIDHDVPEEGPAAVILAPTPAAG